MEGANDNDNHYETSQPQSSASGMRSDSYSSRIDGNDFLHSLRNSVPDSHYNRQQQHQRTPQTVGERMASLPPQPQVRETLDRSTSKGSNNSSQKQVSLQDVLQAEPVEQDADAALLLSLEGEQQGRIGIIAPWQREHPPSFPMFPC